MASSDAVCAAAMEKAGIVSVGDLEGLCEAAAFFAKAPPPSGKGPFVMSGSGGACVIAAAKCEQAGVTLPPLDEGIKAKLAKELPSFTTPENPCDLTAMVVNRPESYVSCLNAFFDHPDFDAAVVVTPNVIPGTSEERYKLIKAVAERSAH